MNNKRNGDDDLNDTDLDNLPAYGEPSLHASVSNQEKQNIFRRKSMPLGRWNYPRLFKKRARKHLFKNNGLTNVRLKKDQGRLSNVRLYNI